MCLVLCGLFFDAGFFCKHLSEKTSRGFVAERGDDTRATKDNPFQKACDKRPADGNGSRA
jgi:hypothetical protein